VLHKEGRAIPQDKPTRSAQNRARQSLRIAFAIPSLAPRVGGLETPIREGVNGRLLEPDRGVDGYCGRIIEIFQDWERYRSIALSSFGEYEQRLNWNASCAEAGRLMEKAVSARHDVPSRAGMRVPSS
jgi:hypothetical protein